MNPDRRKRLAEIHQVLQDWSSALQEAHDEEQDHFDQMPENLQGSERGEKSEAAADALRYAINALNEAMDQIEEAMGT